MVGSAQRSPAGVRASGSFRAPGSGGGVGRASGGGLSGSLRVPSSGHSSSRSPGGNRTPSAGSGSLRLPSGSLDGSGARSPARGGGADKVTALVAPPAQAEIGDDALRRENAELKLRVRVLETAQKRLSGDVDAQRTEKADHAARVLELEAQETQFQEELQSKNVKIAEQAALISKFTSQIEAQRSEAQEHDSRIKRAESNHDQLMVEVEVWRRERKDHEAHVSEVENARKRLQNKLDAQRKDNEVQAARLMSCERNCNQLVAEIDNLRRERQIEAASLAEVESVRRRLYGTVDAQRREKEQLFAKLAEVELAKKVLQEQLEKMRKEKAKQGVRLLEVEQARQRLMKYVRSQEKKREEYVNRIAEVENAMQHFITEAGEQNTDEEDAEHETTLELFACPTAESVLLEPEAEVAPSGEEQAEPPRAKVASEELADVAPIIAPAAAVSTLQPQPETAWAGCFPVLTARLRLARAALAGSPKSLAAPFESVPSRPLRFDVATSTEELEREQEVERQKESQRQSKVAVAQLALTLAPERDAESAQEALINAESVVRELRFQVEAWRQPPRHPARLALRPALRSALPDESLRLAAEAALRVKCCSNRCTAIKSLRVVHVRPIINDILWQNYQNSKESMRLQHMRTNAKSLTSILPEIQTVVQENFPWIAQNMDVSLNERLAFHGTAPDFVEQIAQRGFDERLANLAGLYGAGIYFAEQGCKASRYSGTGSLRCVLLTRVLLGEPFFATGPMRSVRRPPLLDANDPQQGLYDSVVAEVGTPTGRHGDEMQHRVFVLFEGKQAYPEMAVYFEVNS